MSPEGKKKRRTFAVDIVETNLKSEKPKSVKKEEVKSEKKKGSEKIKVPSINKLEVSKLEENIGKEIKDLENKIRIMIDKRNEELKTLLMKIPSTDMSEILTEINQIKEKLSNQIVSQGNELTSKLKITDEILEYLLLAYFEKYQGNRPFEIVRKIITDKPGLFITQTFADEIISKIKRERLIVKSHKRMAYTITPAGVEWLREFENNNNFNGLDEFNEKIIENGIAGSSKIKIEKINRDFLEFLILKYFQKYKLRPNEMIRKIIAEKPRYDISQSIAEEITENLKEKEFIKMIGKRMSYTISGRGEAYLDEISKNFEDVEH